MQHLLTPYATTIEPYAWWEGAFTEDQLNWLQQQAKNASDPAIVGSANGGVEDKNIRRSSLYWMHKNSENAWVYDILADVASALNAQYFRFDLTGFGEALQLTNYDQAEHGMYGWHQDYNAKISRKLSLVLQLTDPAEYEGGNLEVMTQGEPMRVRKQRGIVAAFPSYVLHQVTPVVKGSRQSLVAWVSGPAFR